MKATEDGCNRSAATVQMAKDSCPEEVLMQEPGYLIRLVGLARARHIQERNDSGPRFAAAHRRAAWKMTWSRTDLQS